CAHFLNGLGLVPCRLKVGDHPERAVQVEAPQTRLESANTACRKLTNTCSPRFYPSPPGLSMPYAESGKGFLKGRRQPAASRPHASIIPHGLPPPGGGPSPGDSDAMRNRSRPEAADERRRALSA